MNNNEKKHTPGENTTDTPQRARQGTWMSRAELEAYFRSPEFEEFDRNIRDALSHRRMPPAPQKPRLLN